MTIDVEREIRGGKGGEIVICFARNGAEKTWGMIRSEWLIGKQFPHVRYYVRVHPFAMVASRRAFIPK